jgi:DNA-directed RNA polymerase alpha subunit
MAVQRALDDYLATEWPPYAVPVFTQAQMLALPLAALNLTTRPHNCLEKRVNILGDIITYGESRLRDMRNFGPGCVRETRSKLALYDLVLGE